MGAVGARRTDSTFVALVLPASNFGDMSEFSLHLSDDQLQIKDWIHEFAKDVMRPAAQEWDDREEFPWPVVQEAAKIGLYGIDFMMSAM